jgi:hypothetical protein
MLQKHHHSPERDKHPDAALEEKDVLIQDGEQEETKQDVKPGSVRTSRNFLPIIMSWCLVFLCAWLPLSAQIEGTYHYRPSIPTTSFSSRNMIWTALTRNIPTSDMWIRRMTSASRPGGP